MNLQEIFHQMNKESIEEFVRESRDEDLLLEFKTVNSSDLSHSDDKKNLARCLSGFANSAGGLIVWGVADEKSCATEIREIDQLSSFKMKLEEHSSSWISPPPDGVLHKVITMSGPDKGCAVTFVPESDSVPHMYNSEHRYYKRNGNRFLPMEHYEVADMFGRRKRPKLEFFYRIHSAELVKVPAGPTVRCEIAVGLRNIGKGSAKFPYLNIKVSPPFSISYHGLDGNTKEPLPRLPTASSGDLVLFGGDANIVIHPNTVLEITMLNADIPKGDAWKNRKEPDIEYQIAAEEMRMIEGSAVINRYDLGTKAGA
jgi:hypothetical protein